MPLGTQGFRSLLSELTRHVKRDASRLASHMGRFSAREGREFISEAFPELLRPYIDAAGDLTVEYYDGQPTTSTTIFVPQPADPPPDEQVAASGRWGIEQPDPGGALGTSGERIVFNHSRNTVLENVMREGVRWAREARPDACSFCKLMATRGAIYYTEATALSVQGTSVKLTVADLRAIHEGRMTRDEALYRRMFYRTKHNAEKAGKQVGDLINRSLRGTRERGESWHDHCFCVAVPVREGDTYKPPEYAQHWKEDYRDAVTAAEKQMAKQGEHRQITLNDILNGWDRNDRAARGLMKPGPKPKAAASK